MAFTDAIPLPSVTAVPEESTAEGPLDHFWAAPGVVDPEAFRLLRKVLIDRSLLHGGFHSEEGLSLLVSAAIARFGLDAGRVPQ